MAAGEATAPGSATVLPAPALAKFCSADIAMPPTCVGRPITRVSIPAAYISWIR